MVVTFGTSISEPEALASAEEALVYILNMVEQLAKMAARNGAKDLASDLFAVCAEAKAQLRRHEH